MITKTYWVSGMTCNGCRDAVHKKIDEVEEVVSVDVDLEKGKATVVSENSVDIENLQEAIGSKYRLSHIGSFVQEPKLTKLQQLRPLFIIFGCLFTAAILLNYDNWQWHSFMYDFMGLFFIVFSFFKLLDLKGFPPSFRMYDPLAKALPFYAWIYPFLEVALGLLFLMRIELTYALIATIVILGITTVGVTRSLLDKRKIQCACLGTALKLPMTEATFIENTLMIAMAIIMLLNPMAL